MKDKILLLYILIAALLLFIGLDNNYFWDDEASTALFARNILSYGLPYGWDGVNLVAYGNGYTLTNHLINTTEPWLEFYITAFFFSLFGINNLAGRLPFVIASLVSVLVFYKFLKAHIEDKLTVNIALLFLILSPSFLLYSRQCRYYSLTILFSLLSLYFLFKFLDGKLNIAYFVAVSILLLHSNHLVFFAFYFSSLIISFPLVYKRRKIKEIVTSSFIILIYAAIWLLYLRPWERIPLHIQSILFSLDKIKNMPALFYYYFRNFNDVAILPIFYIISLPIILLERRNGHFTLQKKNLGIVLIILLVVIINVFLSPEEPNKGFADIRYTINLLPLICLIIALTCSRVFNWSKVIGSILVLITIFTNILCFRPFKMYLIDYIYEVTHDYVTPYEAACSFIEKEARPMDIILVEPDFFRAPLFFYLSNFRFCSVLTEDNHLIHNKRAILPDYIYSSKVIPDWIITFCRQPIRQDIFENIKKNNILFEEYIIPMHCYDCTRPELYWHCFYPRPPVPGEGIYIYRKVSAAQ